MKIKLCDLTNLIEKLKIKSFENLKHRYKNNRFVFVEMFYFKLFKNFIKLS